MKYLSVVLCFILSLSCSKSTTEESPATVIEVKNSYISPIQNVLISYKLGGDFKLYVNIGYLDRTQVRDTEIANQSITEVYIFFDIIENNVTVTKMVKMPFVISRGGRTTIQLSAIQEVQVVNKSSSSYPGGQSPNPGGSCGTHNGRQLYKGPDGGCYYINSNGNKTYVARSECNC